jgi:hypothetical protein
MARATKRKKAKKAAPVKARVKTRSKTPTKAISPDTGPVTLEEARALAAAKQPGQRPKAVDRSRRCRSLPKGISGSNIRGAGDSG